jgi:hypothetical protein
MSEEPADRDPAIEKFLSELSTQIDSEFVPDVEMPHAGVAALSPKSKSGKLYKATLEYLVAARSPEHNDEVTMMGAVQAASSWVLLQAVDAELARGGAPKPIKVRHYLLDEDGNARRANENDRERWRVHRDTRAHYKMLVSSRSSLIKDFMNGLKIMGLAHLLDPTKKPQGFEDMIEQMQNEQRRQANSTTARTGGISDAEFTECDPAKDSSPSESAS